MPDSTLDPWLVTLGFDPSTFERLDRLRARYFPPELNKVPAHLSLFHQLPGEEGDEVGEILWDHSRKSRPLTLHFPGVKRMSHGVLALVEAPGLAGLRTSLARAFSSWLTAQDRQPFHPHVTIMNKATPDQVGRAWGELQPGWSPWSGSGDRLILWRYRGGPWESVDQFALGSPGNPPMARPEV